MKLERITNWLDGLLHPDEFDDVSNNGIQIERKGDEVKKVAFAVDASRASVEKAVAAGAQLLVVHHGISWGGGIKRITGGEYNVIKAAIEGNLALYASHLPLDANKKVGNNWELARYFGLKEIVPAFNYHGNVIGVIGKNAQGCKIGICSGGAGSFAGEAKNLGCELYVTGEADWGEKIAAENIDMRMITAGHYETETFGVKALMRAMKKALKISVTFVTLMLSINLWAESYVGAAGKMVLPQKGVGIDRVGGGVVRAGYYIDELLAIEGEAGWLERNVGLALRGLWHWYGYERIDPFFTFGAEGWIDGEIGPTGGVGTFYHLSDEVSLRFEAEATYGLDGEDGMVYSLAAGVQYSF